MIANSLENSFGVALAVLYAAVAVFAVGLSVYVLTERARVVVSGHEVVRIGRWTHRYAGSNVRLQRDVYRDRWEVFDRQSRRPRATVAHFVDADRERVVAAFAAAGAEIGLRTDENVPAETRGTAPLYEAKLSTAAVGYRALAVTIACCIVALLVITSPGAGIAAGAVVLVAAGVLLWAHVTGRAESAHVALHEGFMLIDGRRVLAKDVVLARNMTSSRFVLEVLESGRPSLGTFKDADVSRVEGAFRGAGVKLGYGFDS